MNARFLPGSPIESAKTLLLLNDSTSARIIGLTNDEIRYSHKLLNLADAEPCQDQRSRRGFFCFARARPWTRCRAMPCAQLHVGSAGPFVSIRLKTQRSRPKQVPTRLYARTAPGAGPRPCFEGAQGVRRCAAFFGSAHLGKCRRFLRRCAPISKVRTKSAPLRRETGSVTGSGRLVRFDICDAMPNC